MKIRPASHVLSSAVLLTLLALPAAGASSQRLSPTPSTGRGPFFPVDAAAGADFVTDGFTAEELAALQVELKDRAGTGGDGSKLARWTVVLSPTS